MKGSGNVVTQTRSFSGFTGVDVLCYSSVCKAGLFLFSVKVETDDNIQSYSDKTRWEHTPIMQAENANLDATGKIKVCMFPHL